MAIVKDHYDRHLAAYYTWLSGGIEARLQESREFFRARRVQPSRRFPLALDLGCGCGFQAIPLAELGYEVIAIDLSERLLAELKTQAGDLPIRTFCDDLTKFRRYGFYRIEVCTCMGDTLTHLETLEQVQHLLTDVHAALAARGRFLLTLRDLTTELKDLDRFIPVRADERTIFTCFLEFEEQHVKIHDIVHQRVEGGWALKKSSFRKLRIDPQWLREEIVRAGFEAEEFDISGGWLTVVARKP